MDLKTLIKNSKLYSKLLPYIFLFKYPIKLYEFLELTKDTNNIDNGLVLDLGCGEGFQTILLKKRFGKILGIDPDIRNVKFWQQMLSIYNNGINFICGDLHAIKIKQNSFNKIFSFCVIEHIPEYQNIFNQVFYILKDNGHFLFSVDSLEIIEDKNIIEKHRKLCSVYEYFKKDSLEKALKLAGFKKIQIYPILKSEFARNFFTQAIIKHNWRGNIFTFFKLRFGDKKENQKGIFLIAKCIK